MDSERLKYRTEHWHNNFKNYISLLKDLKPTILCGDFNVAHTTIDIHAPEKHTNYAGFLPIERKQFTEYLELGYIDETRNILYQSSYLCDHSHHRCCSLVQLDSNQRLDANFCLF